MDSLSILIAIVIVVGFAAILIGFSTKKSSSQKKGKKKNRAQIIKEANRKLGQDPHNPAGLKALGEIYFNEHNWEKAYQLYDTMLNIAPAHTEIEPFTAALRQGICSVKLNKIEDAFRGLSTAYQINSSNFDVNYYLGIACYTNKEYEKAIPVLKKALVLKPEATNVNTPLALSLYKAKHYKESLGFLRRALNENPDSKELLYSMADAMEECGYGEKALKIFMHLRPDPEYGARSSLQAGMIHYRVNAYDKAMQDFEIALKHQNIPQELLTEIRYRYAQVCFATKNIGMGITHLREIQIINPQYKDVSQLLSRYSELNQNKNLQVYLMSGTSDFVALCRKIVLTYHAKSMVKIQDISVQTDYVEILIDVDSSKWEDVQFFRFYRSTGSIGEFSIRDFQGKVSDGKADRGICFTAGTFSDEAKKYADGRPIDLVPKENLIKILKKIDV